MTTVGLGVSGFVYRMDSVHRHGHGEREATGSVPQAEGVHKYCPLHCNYSSVDPSLSQSPLESLYPFSPTHPCLYSTYIYSHSRFISNRYKSLLSAVATGLDMPLQATVRPTHSDEIGQSHHSYTPCAFSHLQAIFRVRMWRVEY